MSSVEIVHLAGCASLDLARQRVEEALGVLGRRDVDVRVRLVGPDTVISGGSPSIMLDGQELFGLEDGAGGWACRIYLDERGRVEGVPPLGDVVEALRVALARPGLVEARTGEARKGEGA